MDNAQEGFGAGKPGSRIVAGPGVAQGEIEGEREFMRRVAEKFRENLVQFIIDEGGTPHLTEENTPGFRILHKPNGYDFEIPVWRNGIANFGMLFADDEMMEYSRRRGIVDPEDRKGRIYLAYHGSNLRDLLETFNTGFMRRHGEHYAIDIDEIARECNFDLDNAIQR